MLLHDCVANLRGCCPAEYILAAVDWLLVDIAAPDRSAPGFVALYPPCIAAVILAAVLLLFPALALALMHSSHCFPVALALPV
jgi:hypothetical protein